MVINKFRGEYRFLSNFYPAYVRYEGDWYASVEHAYQAAKTKDPMIRQMIKGIDRPGDVKRFSHQLIVDKDWDKIKYDVMLDLVRQKFTNIDRLKMKLLDTGNATLIEGNWWHDNYWGVCVCAACQITMNFTPPVGSNKLGKILMQVRGELRNEGENQEK